MRSESALECAVGEERRLHPLSWLFLMLQQLKQFALPLLALLLFGRGGGEWWESLGALGALLVAVVAVLQYFTYRFRIADGELTIRSGLLQRNVRHIPLARIQNVVLRRNLLHRIAGVAEVRLESAAGRAEAEAEMRVLALADATALEQLVRRSKVAASGDGAASGEEAAAEALLQLPVVELVRLGLSSNRGMVVVAAGYAAAWQIGDDFTRQLHNLAARAFSLVSHWLPGPLQWALGGLLLLLLAMIALRLLSVALAILRLYDFRLHDEGERLSIEGGLLTRWRGHAARSRIQRWLIGENVWQRLLQRRCLRVDTAAVRRSNDEHGLSELVPIAPNHTLDALLQRWLPQVGWPQLDWQPLHPRAWRRFFVPPALVTTLLTAVLGFGVGLPALLLLLLLPCWAWRARRIAAFSAYHCDTGVVAWRSGFIDRRWQLVEIDRIQLLRIEHSPFDRRHGMASLLLDTAGADPTGEPLRLRHLPAAVAERLAAQIGAQLARGG